MLLGLAVAPVHAVGFGRIANATQLGQPLNFAASVRLDADEVLPRECVAAEVQVEQIVIVADIILRHDRRDVEVHAAFDAEEVVADLQSAVDCDAEAAARIQPAGHVQPGESEQIDTRVKVESP